MSCFLSNNEVDSFARKTCFQAYTIGVLISWRNNAVPGTADAWGRRFAIIIPVVLLALIGLIDNIASFALSFLLFPGEFCGSRLYQFFFIRSVYGVSLTVYALTYLQYLNFTEDTIQGKKKVE